MEMKESAWEVIARLSRSFQVSSGSDTKSLKEAMMAITEVFALSTQLPAVVAKAEEVYELCYLIWGLLDAERKLCGSVSSGDWEFLQRSTLWQRRNGILASKVAETRRALAELSSLAPQADIPG